MTNNEFVSIGGKQQCNCGRQREGGASGGGKGRKREGGGVRGRGREGGERERETDREGMHACVRVRDDEWCLVTWPNTSQIVHKFCSAKKLIHACIRLYHCTLITHFSGNTNVKPFPPLL